MSIISLVNSAWGNVTFDLGYVDYRQAFTASLLTVEYIHGWRLFLHYCKWPLVLRGQLLVKALGHVRNHMHVSHYFVTDIVFDMSFSTIVQTLLFFAGLFYVSRYHFVARSAS